MAVAAFSAGSRRHGIGENPAERAAQHGKISAPETRGTMQQTPRGYDLLDDPVRNKGTAFTLEERRRYGLEGLLPYAVETLDRQVERVLGHLEAKPTDLERYIYLIGLSD